MNVGYVCVCMIVDRFYLFRCSLLCDAQIWFKVSMENEIDAPIYGQCGQCTRNCIKIHCRRWHSCVRHLKLNNLFQWKAKNNVKKIWFASTTTLDANLPFKHNLFFLIFFWQGNSIGCYVVNRIYENLHETVLWSSHIIRWGQCTADFCQIIAIIRWIQIRRRERGRARERAKKFAHCLSDTFKCFSSKQWNIVVCMLLSIGDSMTTTTSPFSTLLSKRVHQINIYSSLAATNISNCFRVCLFVFFCSFHLL